LEQDFHPNRLFINIKYYHMNTNTKILLGIIGAATAGAVIGMLMAPEKGTDMRKLMKNTANDWLTAFSDMLATGKGKVAEVKDNLETAANRYTGATN
jgi:gas vesicle protein